MQIYKFKSLEGVSFSFVTKIILEMVDKESYLSISQFDVDAYELLIGQDVLDVLPNALRSTKKLWGIDALIMYSVDKANCIILDKKDDGKFKDLSPRIFDTIYDDIIKAVLMNHITVSVGDKRSKGDFKMMNFGQAIEALKNGKKVARVGWNGKGMFLYYVPVGAYAPCTEIAASLVNENGLVEYGAYIAMKTAQGNVVPWLASQTDILAEDWYVVE